MFFPTFNQLPTVVDHPRTEDGKKDEHQVLHSLSSKHVVLLKNLIWECWHVIAFNETSLEK